MLLNVKKGPYPSLIQMDAEKLLSEDETIAVERGMALYVDADDEWRVAMAANAGDDQTPGAFIFFSLQPEGDLTAGMAGGVPTTGGRPKLAALAVSPTQRIETDMFVEADNLVLNQFVTIADGGRLSAHANGNTAYGRVAAAPYTRWVNNAPAVAGWRTGNNVHAIQVHTMYVPCLPA